MILIVDDKSENIFALKHLLEINDFNVDTALSGEAALKKVLKNDYSLIILDVQMPGMDGFEVAEIISAYSKAKDVPIMFLSAVNTDKKFIARGYKAGGVDYIPKPVDPDILLLKVKTFHRLYEQSRELNDMQLAMRREIEARKTAQQEQQRKTMELQSILESIPQLAFTANAAGVIEYANEHWYSYSYHKNTFPEIYDKDELVSDYWQNTFASIPPRSAEVCLKKLESTECRYHLLNLVPVKENNTIVKWVGTFTDIHEQKLAKDLLEKRVEERTEELVAATRLYAYISQINHSIVHATDEQTVFREACRIAIETGKFEMAFICMPDQEKKKMNIVEQNKIPAADLEYFHNLIYDIDWPAAARVLQSGKLHVINNYENAPLAGDSKRYAWEKGFKSCILLPIKKSGKTIGIYNLFSSVVNLFDKEEIALLHEAAGDISFALDVFEKEKHRKEMEDKVKQNELRLMQAQAIAHIGSWEEDILTGTELWSDEICRIYGIPVAENEQSQESWESFIHPDDSVYVMKMVKESQIKLSDSAFYHRIIRKDGTIRYIYSQSHFEFNESGKPVAKYGVAHDVTEVKDATLALQQSEKNLHQIMDLIPQYIFTRDIEGKYLFVNKSFAALNGLTPFDLIQKSIIETIPSKSEAEHFLKLDREVILSGETKTIPEHTFTDYKGTPHLFQTVKVPYTIAGTNEKAVLCINRDITDQKSAETERSKMVADIMHRNENLEQFSYIISHNLREPVANILGLTEILQTIVLDKEDKKTTIGYLDIAAKKLDVIVRDINDILNVGNTMNKKMECISFSAILDEIKSSIRNSILSEHVQIITDFSEAPEILTIKSYLYSIFINLISNSIKYRKNNAAPVIRITSSISENKIRVLFADNGLGLDMKMNNKNVFGLYKRFHNHVEGKGMGLYMVKTQLETLGGTIMVNSEVGKGTEFTIEFVINE